MVAAFGGQQHVAQYDARSVNGFSGEYVAHQILVQIVDELVLFQARHHVIDDDLVQELVWETELM